MTGIHRLPLIGSCVLVGVVLLIAEATVVAMSLTAATGSAITPDTLNSVITTDTASTAIAADAAGLAEQAWWLLPACAVLYAGLTYLLLWRTATTVHVRGQRLRWIAPLGRGTLHVSRLRPVWPRRIPLRSRLGVALIRERGGGWVLVWIGPGLAGLVELVHPPGHPRHPVPAGQARRAGHRALPRHQRTP